MKLRPEALLLFLIVAMFATIRAIPGWHQLIADIPHIATDPIRKVAALAALNAGVLTLFIAWWATQSPRSTKSSHRR